MGHICHALIDLIASVASNYQRLAVTLILAVAAPTIVHSVAADWAALMMVGPCDAHQALPGVVSFLGVHQSLPRGSA